MGYNKAQVKQDGHFKLVRNQNKKLYKGKSQSNKGPVLVANQPNWFVYYAVTGDNGWKKIYLDSPGTTMVSNRSKQFHKLMRAFHSSNGLLIS